MVIHTTDAGTEVIELSEAEFVEYLDAETRSSVGVSADEFREAVRAGTVDWDDPEAFYIAGLLGVNGSGA